MKYKSELDSEGEIVGSGGPTALRAQLSSSASPLCPERVQEHSSTGPLSVLLHHPGLCLCWIAVYFPLCFEIMGVK